MKAELRLIEGDGEIYEFLLTEDDDGRDKVLVGKITRTGPNDWLFVPSKDESVSVTLHSANKDELLQLMHTRFAAAEISADRVRNRTMFELVRSVVLSLNVFAEKTDSMSVLVEALAHCIAFTYVHDCPNQSDETFAAFKRLLLARINTHIAASRGQAIPADSIAEFDELDALFNAEEIDAGATKH